MKEPVKTYLLGIVGETLYISGNCGDYYTATLDKFNKQDLVEYGVIEYPNRDYIECQLYGMSYEEYLVYIEEMSKLDEHEDTTSNDIDDLPF